jgi:hypothetical protein
MMIFDALKIGEGEGEGATNSGITLLLHDTVFVFSGPSGWFAANFVWSRRVVKRIDDGGGWSKKEAKRLQFSLHGRGSFDALPSLSFVDPGS